jgi:hypothetical protein
MISSLEKPVVFGLRDITHDLRDITHDLRDITHDLRDITQRPYSTDNIVKFKAVSVHIVKAYAGVEVQLHSFLTRH